MTIEQLKNNLPEYAKDIKLNLGTIITDTGSPGLNQKQIVGIALSSAYATRNKELIHAMNHLANEQLSLDEINAAKSATIIMAMNNIYYRFTHSVSDQSYNNMPINLRMNVMLNPGGDKIDFELNCLAVSAINGCGKCMNAHTAQLEKAGISKQGIQSTIRIASVMNATAIANECLIN